MNGLKTIECGTEEEYIKIFYQEYAGEINTPDGFKIICRDLERRAKHFCGGKQEIFQKSRAQRILWAKGILLLDPSERKVLVDQKTKNFIFFFAGGKTSYAVICSQIKGCLDLISGFIVGGKRAEAYKNGELPYLFYQPETKKEK